MEKLFFLGCNYLQLDYLQRLRDIGFRIVGIDKNGSAPGKGLCDAFYQCGYNEYDRLVEIGKIEGFSGRDKVFTAASQFAHLGAARFASSFAIAYPSSESIQITLDKTMFYHHFEKLGVPIPDTYLVCNYEELIQCIEESDIDGWLYLKSDFSKNPNYVYRIHCSEIKENTINWTKDRYLQNNYVLQPEVEGVSLRINIYGNRFNVYDFETSKKTSTHNAEIETKGVLKALQKISSSLGFKDWLVKFDVILDQSNFVVLDIGIDPPSRMRSDAEARNLPFIEPYLEQYLLGEITYSESLDS